MKTPNELKKIYNRLPKDKTELAKAEKIELSLAGDIKKSLNSLKGLMKKGESMRSKMETSYEKVQTQIDKLEDMGKPAESLMSEIYKLTDAGKDLLQKAAAAAKELGVSPDDIEGYKEFKEVRGNGYFVGKGLQDELFNLENLR
jgi:biotin operon repressor